MYILHIMIRTCEICNFTTKYKNVYDNHNKSARHIRRKNTINEEISAEPDLTPKVALLPEEFDDNPNNLCCLTCKKIYTTRSGLWKHKKTCKPPTEGAKNTFNSVEINQELLESNIQLHKELKDLKEAHENQIKTLLSTFIQYQMSP